MPPAHAANLGSLSRKTPPLAKSTLCYAVISVCRLRSRDRLFAGWARSKLVALEVADLGFEPEGVVLTIRRSKTDREGAGATVAVPLGAEEGSYPVGALRRWLEAAATSEGRVFRRIDRHGNLGPTLSDRGPPYATRQRCALVL